MSAPHSTPLLPLSPVTAVLAMLGVQPDDDAWVLGQSGPALTPSASAALCAWRLQQSLRQLLAVAPVWAASLQSPVATTAILATFAGHPWHAFLQQLWSRWRASVLVQQAPAQQANPQANSQTNPQTDPHHVDADTRVDLPSLATALNAWQREHERCWQALSANESAQLLAAASWPGFEALVNVNAGALHSAAQHALPSHWQTELQAMAQQAGRLSAQALQQPAAAQPGQRTLHWQQHDARLYRYPAAADATPILLVYAWINRPDVLDLSPSQSLIAALQAQGLAVWLLDWADSGAQGLSLDAYLTQLLQPALQQVCAASEQQRVAVLGVCQGGTLALSLAMHQEALNQATQNDGAIASLSLVVTPVDFHTADDRLSACSQALPAASLASVQAHSPATLNLAFLNLKPYSLRTGKYLSLLLQSPSAEALASFLRLEHWLLSGPLLSGPALATYLERFYQRNSLCRPEQTGASSAWPLGALQTPLQLLIAEHDHIVPPASSLALTELTAQSVQVERLSAGHIGVLVGRQREQLAAKVATFVRSLKAR